MSDIPETVPAEALGSAPAIEVKHRGLITLSIMAATIMQVLDTTIANVALPSMTGDLGASQDTITWVLTSYIIATAQPHDHGGKPFLPVISKRAVEWHSRPTNLVGWELQQS